MQGARAKVAHDICPNGWHVPSEAEWTMLFNYLGGESEAGGKMKETGTLHWKSPNMGASNIAKFTILPSGGADFVKFNGYYGLHTNAYFWSSSCGIRSGSALELGFDHNEKWIWKQYTSKTEALSVRCILD